MTPSPTCFALKRHGLPCQFRFGFGMKCQSQVCCVYFFSRVCQSPGLLPLLALLTLEQWLSFLPPLPTLSWQREESEIGERSDQGESNSLWVLLVTPRKACFSSLKFQEMFYGLNRIIGLCQIGVCRGGGFGWGGWGQPHSPVGGAECWLPSGTVSR